MLCRQGLRLLLLPAIRIGSLLLFVSLPAQSQVLVPPDLAVGQQYRLVYVTSTTRNALPTDISVYDTFVQNQSNDSNIGIGSPIGDITWQAIGSTAAVDAIDHVAGVGPIYRLDGVRVSDTAAGLWDGGIDVPIIIDDEAAIRDVFVYTGTEDSGVAALAGATPVRLGDSSARLGDSGEFDMDWVETGFFSSSAIGRAFYAISETLTVPPPAVPAHPAWLSGMLFAGLAAIAQRRLRGARPG